MNENQTQQNNFLVITALGENSSNLASEFTNVVKECHCNIIESRINIFGAELLISMYLSGSWNAIAKVEAALSKIESRSNIKIHFARTVKPVPDKKLMPYVIDIVSFDDLDIVNNIVKFVTQNKIQLHEVTTNTYIASHTGANMFSMRMIVNVPNDVSIASIREEFMDFCEQLNLDAMIEPVK